MTRRWAAILGVAAATAVCGAATGREVRVITAPGLTPPPRFEDAPERIAPPTPPVTTAPIVARRLGPVVVEDGAAVRSRRMRVRLAGVAAIERDETCRDPSDVEWPCGARALVGLRRMVRLRPVDCLLPQDARSGSFETTCAFVAGGDLGEAFVASGWARAAPGGPYAEAEATARRDGRGVWGVAPTLAPAATSGPPISDELPPDLTTAPLPGAAETSAAPTPLGR
ncbi:MAG: thermonuclease family protein [Hyphomicrobiales bacterium]|nr:thermonuclease family protein [Hyphomicrobiales bacterium]